jgi:hypothetical protein
MLQMGSQINKKKRLCSDCNLRLPGCSPSFAQEVNASNDLLRVVWLFQWPIVTEIAGLISGPCDSRGQNHIDFEMIFANLPGKSETVKAAGKANLGQYNINLSSGFQYGEDIVSIHALDNLVATIAQIVCDDHSRQHIRLDHKDHG